jgi:RNA polymerase sigma-70 factor (ECF subfamily)
MPAAGVDQRSDVRSNVERAGEVFEEYGRFIHSVIRFHVKDESEAEDLFQDLFLFLVAKPIPDHVRNKEGFLFRVISDRAKDALRRVDRYQAKMRRYARHSVPAIEDRPEHVVMEVEEAQKTFELIEKRLPTAQSSALDLRYRRNYTISEVAERMGVTARSASKYICVGLTKIRQVVSEQQGDSL